MPDSDAWREAWDGCRLSVDAALSIFGADRAFPMSEMPRRLAAIVDSAPTVAINSEPRSATFTRSPEEIDMTSILASVQSQGRLESLRPSLHQLRWIKSPAELNLMRRSAAVAADAMRACMRSSRPGVQEHFLASLFEWRCKSQGAQRLAYPSVVAGGVDAVTIHYSRNDKRLTAEDLLLFDGGCEMFGYCSDITRTWPIGGKFNGAQLAVYDSVLMAHRRLLSACRPGATLRQLHHLSLRLLAESLKSLELFPSSMSIEAIMADPRYRTFYPHSVGHLLGLDVHDAPTNSHDKPLQPGVALTIEPGLYIPDDDSFGSLRGIGVRIEDDVAITDAEPEILSAKVPSDVKEIEELVGTEYGDSSG